MKTASSAAALSSAVALAPALALAAPTTWNVDPGHSTAGFAVRHLVISTVRGEFTKYAGKVELDEADVTRSTVEATLDVASIDTRVPDRDAHLKSPDFFDAARYPTITFRSTRVVQKGPDELAVTGDLTMRGVTKAVTLDVTTSPAVKGLYGETRRAFSATTKLSRKAYGLAWNQLIEAGPAVGDEVKITLDLEVVKAEPKAVAQ